MTATMTSTRRPARAAAPPRSGLTLLVPQYRAIIDGPRLWVPGLRMQITGAEDFLDELDIEAFVNANPGLIPGMKQLVQQGPDVQVFLPKIPSIGPGEIATGAGINGNWIWNRPYGAKWMRVILIAAGGGGGGGPMQTAVAAAGGGGGGGGGGLSQLDFCPEDWPEACGVFVGCGGAGGAVRSGTSQTGNNGTNGGNTIFAAKVDSTGSAIYPFGAIAGTAGGGGGLAGNGGNGAAGSGTTAGSNGGTGTNGAAGAGGGSGAGCSGGGAGGGLSAANATFGGGSGGIMGATTGNTAANLNSGGAAATNGNQGHHISYLANGQESFQDKGPGFLSGHNGPAGFRHPHMGMGGGGGGSSNSASKAGDGGIAGQFGGGGGGGGAGTNSVSASSGAGACGGDGIAVIITW